MTPESNIHSEVVMIEKGDTITAARRIKTGKGSKKCNAEVMEAEGEDRQGAQGRAHRDESR